MMPQHEVIREPCAFGILDNAKPAGSDGAQDVQTVADQRSTQSKELVLALCAHAARARALAEEVAACRHSSDWRPLRDPLAVFEASLLDVQSQLTRTKSALEFSPPSQRGLKCPAQGKCLGQRGRRAELLRAVARLLREKRDALLAAAPAELVRASLARQDDANQAEDLRTLRLREVEQDLSRVELELAADGVVSTRPSPTSIAAMFPTPSAPPSSSLPVSSPSSCAPPSSPAVPTALEASSVSPPTLTPSTSPPHGTCLSSELSVSPGVSPSIAEGGEEASSERRRRRRGEAGAAATARSEDGGAEQQHEEDDRTSATRLIETPARRTLCNIESGAPDSRVASWKAGRSGPSDLKGDSLLGVSPSQASTATPMKTPAPLSDFAGSTFWRDTPGVLDTSLGPMLPYRTGPCRVPHCRPASQASPLRRSEPLGEPPCEAAVPLPIEPTTESENQELPYSRQILPVGSDCLPDDNGVCDDGIEATALPDSPPRSGPNVPAVGEATGAGDSPTDGVVLTGSVRTRSGCHLVGVCISDSAGARKTMAGGISNTSHGRNSPVLPPTAADPMEFYTALPNLDQDGKENLEPRCCSSAECSAEREEQRYFAERFEACTPPSKREPFAPFLRSSSSGALHTPAAAASPAVASLTPGTTRPLTLFMSQSPPRYGGTPITSPLPGASGYRSGVGVEGFACALDFEEWASPIQLCSPVPLFVEEPEGDSFEIGGDALIVAPEFPVDATTPRSIGTAAAEQSPMESLSLPAPAALDETLMTSSEAGGIASGSFWRSSLYPPALPAVAAVTVRPRHLLGSPSEPRLAAPNLGMLTPTRVTRAPSAPLLLCGGTGTRRGASSAGAGGRAAYRDGLLDGCNAGGGTPRNLTDWRKSLQMARRQTERAERLERTPTRGSSQAARVGGGASSSGVVPRLPAWR